jgi:hypothetical protein
VAVPALCASSEPRSSISPMPPVTARHRGPPSNGSSQRRRGRPGSSRGGSALASTRVRTVGRFASGRALTHARRPPQIVGAVSSRLAREAIDSARSLRVANE